MNLTMRQLRAFLAVAEQGNFTRAAQKLHVTQAGLSAMIRELESQVGAQLFVRTTRRVDITEAGVSLLPYATTALHNLDEAERHLGFLIDQGQRRLRIGLTPLVASTVLPALCRRFMQAQPQITLEIVDADREVLQPMVESGDLDAAYGLFFDSKFGLVRSRVFRGGLALISPKAESDAVRGESVSSVGPQEQVCAMPLLTLRRGSLMERFIDDFLATAQYSVVERREVRHLATLIALVDAGMGWAAIPTIGLLECRRFSNIQKLPLATASPNLDFYCVTKAGRATPAAVDIFSSMIEKECGGLARGGTLQGLTRAKRH